MESLDVVSVVLRAAAFIAALQAAGLAWFNASGRHAVEAAAHSLNGVLRVAALLALVLVLTHRALDAGRLAGAWPGVLDSHLQQLAWSRRPGLSALTCAVGLMILTVVAGSARRWSKYLASVAALAVVGSFALTGHTTEAAHAGWLQVLVALHVGIAAYWLGAVAGLYLLTRRSDPGLVAVAAARFSATAVWFVPLLLPVGAVLIWGLLPNLAALRTAYGGFVLMKALGFCALITLAARNRLKSLPVLAVGKSGAAQGFQRALCAEYALLCGVLAATAAMTSLFSWH